MQKRDALELLLKHLTSRNAARRSVRRARSRRVPFDEPRHHEAGFHQLELAASGYWASRGDKTDHSPRIE